VNGFERMKEQTRRSILDAALELFKSYGFKKVSISEIAQSANVSPVTIYNHFGSKDGLIREVVKALLQDMMERYWALLREDRPFPEKIQAMVFDKTEIGSQFRGELVQTVYQSDPQLREFIDVLFQQEINSFIMEMLEGGKREGYVDPGLSPEALRLFMEILRRGVAASPDLLPGSEEPDIEVLRQLNYIFVYGLMGRSENERR